jgi:hypothetical protein
VRRGAQQLGHTPLHVATCIDRLERVLLEHGAEEDARTGGCAQEGCANTRPEHLARQDRLLLLDGCFPQLLARGLRDSRNNAAAKRVQEAAAAEAPEQAADDDDGARG